MMVKRKPANTTAYKDREALESIKLKNREGSTPASFLQNASVVTSTPFEKNRHKYVSACEDYYYHLSIIDYLQEFNWDKFLENRAKSLINKKKDHNMISAVEPNYYRTRFVNFMKE